MVHEQAAAAAGGWAGAGEALAAAEAGLLDDELAEVHQVWMLASSMQLII
jgi:hypothetical protein